MTIAKKTRKVSELNIIGRCPSARPTHQPYSTPPSCTRTRRRDSATDGGKLHPCYSRASDLVNGNSPTGSTKVALFRIMRVVHVRAALLSLLLLMSGTAHAAERRPRAREVGITFGIVPTGPLNAITDVAGVKIGQVTLIEGANVRTGVTAILPHGGNLYQDKVPAGFAVGNAYGKFMGSTQIEELGEIETPILLTNTLNVPEAAAGIIEWTLKQPGNEQVRSVNAVVGETNDGTLNDIRARRVRPADAIAAIEAAREGPVQEGAVGAGTGTIAFSWKGGIGTSSRKLPANLGGYAVGVLVQTNYGGVLQVVGVPVGQALG